MVRQRYERNIPSINEKEQAALSMKKVAVVGCGGLGGYIIEYLARLGVGTITIIDGDTFSESNLNRQLLSTTYSLNKSKAVAAKQRIAEINPGAVIIAVDQFLSKENAQSLLIGCDLIIDALDNVAARLLLEDTAAKLGIDIVHGAICGWSVQATIARAGAGVLHRLYQTNNSDTSNDPANKTALAMTPACCASIQVSEAIKLLLGRKPSLDGKLLLLDLNCMEMTTIEIK